MTVTGAIVLFAVMWFLILFMALPIGVRSQADDGDVVPGTPGSAPSEPMIRKKIVWTTAITVVLWTIIVGVIVSGAVHINDLNWFGRVDRG